MLSQRWRDIALHHLHVVDVILNEEIIRFDIGDKLNRLVCPVQEKARNVAGVDRLNQKPNTLECEGIRSESEIFDKHFVQLLQICTNWDDADKAIELAAVERFRIIHGLPYAITEFRH